MAANLLDSIYQQTSQQQSSLSNSPFGKTHQDSKYEEETSENDQQRLVLDEIQQSHRCKSWIQQHLVDCSTHLKICRLIQEEALLPSSCNDDDVSNLNERISYFQEDLLTCSSNKSYVKVMLERLLEGQALIKLLFPDTVTESPTPKKLSKMNDVAELCEKNNDLCSVILEYHQELAKGQKELDDFKQKNFDIKAVNRELMMKLKMLKERQNSRVDLLPEEDIMTEAKKRYQYVQSKLHLTANIFQALVVGSGVNWAADAGTRQLVISLGETSQ